MRESKGRLIVFDGTSQYDKMNGALVLIDSKVGAESEIMDALCDMDDMKQAYLVYGLYDIAAIIKASSTGELENIVTEQIRKIAGVESTLSLIISRECK